MSLIDGGIYSGLLHSRQSSSAYTYIYSAVGYSNITIPADVFAAYVECWGGGAGGEGAYDGGNNTISCQGGGGGGYAASLVSVIPGATYSYQVGSGGTYGGATAHPIPYSGGTSFFGSQGCTLATATVRAAGGGGDNAPGTIQIKGGGTALISNIGDLTYNGGNGGFISAPTTNPIKASGGGGGAGPNGGGGTGTVGNGNGGTAPGGVGQSEFGGAGGAGYPLTNPTFPPNRDYGNGSNGVSYGGGGGGAGAWHVDGGVDVIGGSGAQGLVRITFYV
jgi:hypothetical protein